MKRIIKDTIIIGILNVIFAYSYEQITGNEYKLNSIQGLSILFLSAAASYYVDEILEKYFKLKF